jgi:16S rRNA (adenine(1408)-N(1))-methyltransferase
VTIDVGTGDGRAVLRTASAEPGTLAIGLDADAASMAESSRRAARSARRGGRPNALFLVAAAEAPPAELAGIAASVTVTLPWGSLLRGCLGHDGAVAAGIAGLLAPAGALTLVVAPATRDAIPDVPLTVVGVRAATARAFEPFDLRVSGCRPAAAAELRATGSSWAKRLLGRPATDRAAILVVLRLRS